MRNHGPKLNRDWVRLRVKLGRSASTQFATIAAGTLGTIAAYSGAGIRFEADPCEHCRCSLIISHMHRDDFTIVTSPDDWRDTRGKGRR